MIKRSRALNTSRVLEDIWINQEISRIQIAKNLDLDKSTISSIVTELLEIGVIKETSVGEAGPQGGRKPVYLTLNETYGCVLGLELRPEAYTAVAVDLEGNIIYSKFELIQLSGANFVDRFFEINSGQRNDPLLHPPADRKTLRFSEVSRRAVRSAAFFGK
jgi:hypothetical protein